MSYARQIITTDGYQELACPRTRHVTGQIINNATLAIGFGKGGDGRPGTAMYGSDEIYTAVTFGFDRECDAIRVKSFKAGTPVTVNLTALTEFDG